ncbi:hypothetical protein SEPCBS119000_000600 [Sporothrix epigloea]|uniref:Rhodopsin domain-containing protein n=1 Tax=Sporothrix epigloea TaxID=1892477 RepID=A0ABP0D732_9PEZI
MGLYSSAPAALPFADAKPTLLVCWWSTFFCLAIILVRLAGRYVRSERLFVEDRVVALAIIPLFLRIGCVHVVLVFGTNNVDLNTIPITEHELHQRAIGSGLVLATRIFHAATLWIFKIAILEFFKRLSDALSERFSQIALVAIRCILVLTFIAVIISDLTECQPFEHYWTVYPDPGGRCRQGFVQLMTVSACNVVTDLLLVLFPIPIIFFSRFSATRKFQLILIFSLSLGVVGVTVYRATRVMQAHGDQQFRSLLASVELLFATAAANSVVLGSFVRDRGVKKNKFRAGSVVDSMERASVNRSRRPTAHRHWGSDEDLVRGLGLGVQPELRDVPDDIVFGGPPRAVRPAPLVKIDGTAAVSPHTDCSGVHSSRSAIDSGGVANFHAWSFPDRPRSGAANSAQSAQSGLSGHSGQSDDDTLLTRDPLSSESRAYSSSTPRKVSFFDAGNLLGGDNESELDTPRSSTACGLSSSTIAGMRLSTDNVHLAPVHTASKRGLHRGSSALLQDLGGLLGPPSQNRQRSDARQHCLQTVLQGTSSQTLSSPLASQTSSSSRYMPSHMNGLELKDPGGLLGYSSSRC